VRERTSKGGLKLGRESVKGSTAPSILFPIPVAVRPLPRWTDRHPGKMGFAAATTFRDNGSIRSWSVPVNRMADRGPWAGCYPRLRPGRPAATSPGCIRSTLLDRTRDGKAESGCENASSTSAETSVAFWEIGDKVKRSNHYVSAFWSPNLRRVSGFPSHITRNRKPRNMSNLYFGLSIIQTWVSLHSLGDGLVQDNI